MSSEDLGSSQNYLSYSKSNSFHTASGDEDEENRGNEEEDESRGEDLLCLTEPPIYFEPIGGLTNVFFDKDNQQIFCVRSNGVGGVIVKGARAEQNLSFRMEDKGSVVSIKFSPNMNVLAVRRQDKSIEFLNFKSGQPTFPEYSQSFKAKSTRFQDFYWLDTNEILLVSELGFEHYQVFPEKRALKLIKFVSMALNWLIWSREAKLFIISTGNSGSFLNPFIYNGGFLKLPKFEVDLPLLTGSSRGAMAASSQAQNRSFLNEADVVLGCIYSDYYVLVIRQTTPPSQITAAETPIGRKSSIVPPSTSNPARPALMNGYSEIAMYKLLTDNPARKTNILRVHLVGRFTLNIIDDLIIVHHRLTYSSMVFDIKLQGEHDGYVTMNLPIIKRASIKPTETPLAHSSSSQNDMDSLKSSSNDNLSELSSSYVRPNEMYSMNWIMFLPNVIIDAKIGCFWFLELNLKPGDLRPFEDFGDNFILLIEFLLNRKNTKEHILQVCRNAIKAKSSLKIIEILFEKINNFYRANTPLVNAEASVAASMSNTVHSSTFYTSSAQSSSPSTVAGSKFSRDSLPIVEQYEVYQKILYPLLEDEKWWNANSKYTIAIIVEYFRSLNALNIQIEYVLFTLLVNALIKANRLYQLHQFLQYHVLTDSKELACYLISIAQNYSAANQLALDMLSRLNATEESIIDILLSKQLVLSAIRYSHQMNLGDSLMPAKFFETALELNDPFIFYEVFKYFENRNMRLRGTPSFRPEDQCDSYVAHFNSLFQSALNQQTMGQGRKKSMFPTTTVSS